jgi:membrane protein implicated in regulation of membrane protease activity
MLEEARLVDPDSVVWCRTLVSLGLFLIVAAFLVWLAVWASRRTKESKEFADTALEQNARILAMNERMVELLESIERRGSEDVR